MKYLVWIRKSGYSNGGEPFKEKQKAEFETLV